MATASADPAASSRPTRRWRRRSSPGDRLLLDDGYIELRVEGVSGSRITTSVVDGGPLGERKGINAPGVPLPATGLTEKDARDLAFGLALGVDLVAMSFVQRAADLQAARAAIVREGRPTVPLVAKIERPEALERLDEILAAADGVMVARGDLGLEIPLQRVPRVQREIMRRRADARGPDHPGHSGARVDAPRVAADPGRGERRGDGGDAGRRRHHAVGRDRSRRVPGPRRSGARRDHP